MSKAITTKISATSRVAVKIKDNFYTVEYTEERELPQPVTSEEEMEQERQELFDCVNTVVDKQVEDIMQSFQPSYKR